MKKKCFLPLGCKPPAQVQGFSPGRFAAAGNPYGVGQNNVTVCLQTEEQVRLIKLPHLIPLGRVFFDVVVSRSSSRAFSAVPAEQTPPSLRSCHASRGHLLTEYLQAEMEVRERGLILVSLCFPPSTFNILKK